MANRSPLGVFLRSRREGLSPADVGLPEAGRRRTPGLRREELAMLAGISVDYLVRLEQGREQSPSASVLSALSDVLRLDADERRHVLSLVAATTQTEMCPSPAPPSPLSATTVALLERLGTPGCVMEPSGDVLAWNVAYGRLMRDTGLFAHEPPNLLRYTFLEPASRSLYRDWGMVARELVAGLRAAAARCAMGTSLDGLVSELHRGSPDFSRMWGTHEVAERRRGVDRLSHPEVGALELAFEVLLLADPRDRRLFTYLPANEDSAAALDRLLATAGTRAADGARLRILDGGAA